ncbi:MAG: DUF6531 domain-containing protein [Defluviitaleaceae bacterium]|nr:DUF6531 domain-containing protein [Defluviitaleaceae bacterium]
MMTQRELVDMSLIDKRLTGKSLIRKRLMNLKRFTALLLCAIMIMQSMVNVLATFDPGPEWNFIQLISHANNEVISVAHSVTTASEVIINRPFNPIAERAELSFSMYYAPGSSIQVFRLANGVNPADVYSASNPLGELVGYLFGRYDDQWRVFNSDWFETISPAGLSAPVVASPSALSFGSASPSALGFGNTTQSSPSSPSSLIPPAMVVTPSALAFRNIPPVTPSALTIADGILWEGYVVDSGGNHQQLTAGNYVIVVQPAADNLDDSRLLLPVNIDPTFIPIITGLPRSNTTPFGAFMGIPGLHEVNMISGNYFFAITDMTVPVVPTLAFTRSYNAQLADISGHMGNGWRTGFDFFLEETVFGAIITMPDGATIHFRRDMWGRYSAPQARDMTLESTNMGWTLTDRSRTRHYFNSDGNITDIAPINGELLMFNYTNGQLTEVRNRSGSLTLTHENGRIATVTANPGNRTIVFSYDAASNLVEVTNYAGRRTLYTYDNENRLIGMEDNDGWNYLNLTYDNHSRLTSARIGSATVTSTITYGVLNTISTDHLGRSVTYRFNRDRQVTSIEHHDGTEYFEFENGRVVSETARNGRTVRYEYDEHGNITLIIGPDGGRSEFTFNENNLPIRIDRTNPNGQTTTRRYEYDERGNVISFTDENGNTRTFSYDQYNRLITSTDEYGNRTTFGYDDYGRLNSITDPEGNEIRTVYDTRGNPIEITSALGFTTRFEYNDAGHLVSTTDPYGNITRYTVDGRGNITSVTDQLGNIINTTTFNAASQPLTITDAMGNTTTHTYNADGNITRTENPDGGITTYTYDSYGRLLTRTDPRGNVWSFGYDEEWRQNRISGPLGQTLSVSFDARGNMVSFTNARGYVTNIHHNADNRVSRVEDPEGGVIRYEYDARGNLVARYDANNNPWRYVYDSNDRLIKRIDPLGNETHYTYDGNGRLIEVRTPMGNYGTFVYDPDGRLIRVYDAENNATRYQHNKNGQVTRVIYPDGSFTSFEYDAAGRLIQTTDPQGGTIRYEYDAASRLTRVIDQLGNTWQYEYNNMGRISAMIDPMGGRTEFEYDLNGNLIREVNPMGHTLYFQYDALNRLITMTDPRGGITRFEYDADSNLTRTINPDGGIISYAFDGNDRLTRMTRHLDNGQQADTLLVYDPAGNLIEITDPMGHTTNFGYDALGRNIRVDHPDGGRDEFTYNADGRITSVTRRIRSGEYNTTRFEYDRNGRLTRIEDAQGNHVHFIYNRLGQVIQEIDQAGNSRHFVYNANGQLIRFTDQVGNITEFGYDAAGRLIWETTPMAGEGAPREYTRFQHDENGRIVAITDPMQRTTRFTHDALGRILTVTDAMNNTTTYVYDQSGNITKTIDAYGNESIFAYDSMNRLIYARLTGQSEATLYTHDTRGLVTRRISPTAGTELAVYDANGNIVSRTDPNGNVTTYDHDPMGRVRQMNFQDGTTASFAFDYAGRLTTLEDWTGITSFEYDILGRLTNVTDPSGRSAAYTWDSRGNRTSVTVTDPDSNSNPDLAGLFPIEATTSYTFDAANRMRSLTDSGGTTTMFQYQATGQLRSFDSTNGESGVYSYDAAGNRLSATYSFNAIPRREYRWAYDQLNRVITETRTNVGIGLPDDQPEILGYRYDRLGRLIRYYGADGRITNHTYDAAGNMLTSRTTQNGQVIAATEFIYNSRGQLTQRITEEDVFAFTYDAAGNIIRETLNGQTIRELSYNAQNRFFHGINDRGETTTYTFNALGYRVAWETTAANPNFQHQSNIIGQPGSQHLTDVNDLIAELTIQQREIYNPETNTYEPAEPTTSTWFDVMGTTRQAEIVTNRREYLPDFTSEFPRDLLIITEEYTHVMEYGHDLHSVTTIITTETESQNTIIAATRPKLYARTNRLWGIAYFIDPSGIIQSYNEFDPWGNPYTPLPDGQNFVGLNLEIIGFTGFAHDYVLGLYFAHFRLYDPEAKRFNAPDPIRGNIFNPQSLNLYTYVLNSPTNFIDPWGLSPLGLGPSVIATPGSFGSFTPPTLSAPSGGSGSSMTADQAREIISDHFPPSLWDEVANEIRRHNPRMSESEIADIIDRTVIMIATDLDGFLDAINRYVTPTVQSVTVGGAGMTHGVGAPLINMPLPAISLKAPCPQSIWKAALKAADYIWSGLKWAKNETMQGFKWLQAQAARQEQWIINQVNSLFGGGSSAPARLSSEAIEFAVSSTQRLQHAYKHAHELGLGFGKWNNSTALSEWKSFIVSNLTHYTQTFQHILKGGQSVTGYLRYVDGMPIVTFIYNSGEFKGLVASVYKLSEMQLIAYGLR